MKKKRKSLFKRILSAALSFVVGITTFAGFGSNMTAKADGRLDLRSIYGEFWYFNGVSPNGYAFCIGLNSPTDSGYFYMQDSDNRLSKAEKKAVGLAQYYGYPNTDKSTDAYCATQAIVWDIVHKKRDLTTYKLYGSDSHYKYLWGYDFNGDGKTDRDWYNKIANAMIHHYDVPSFNNKTVHLEWKASEHAYYKAFYDYNDVLNDKDTRTAFVNKLEAIDGISKVTCTKDSSNGHYVTKIWATKPINNKPVSLVKKFDVVTGNYTRVCTYFCYGYQDLMSGFDDPNADPPTFVITLDTEDDGSATITKKYVDETGATVTGSAKTTLASATKFVIKDSTGAYLKLTGSAGNYTYSTTVSAQADATKIALTSDAKFTVSGMPKGTYTLIETAAPTRYAKLANKKFTIKSGNSTQKSYTNKQNPSPNYVTLSKEWVDADGEIMSHDDFVKKFGTDYANEAESAVEFLAYIKVNGKRFYFTDDYYHRLQQRGGDTFTTTHSKDGNFNLFYEAPDEEHYYQSAGTTNLTDVYNHAYKYNITGGKTIIIGYLFDKFEDPAFFGLSASNNKWTDKTVYFEEVVLDRSGKIKYWSSNPAGAVSRIISTAVPVTDDGEEGTAYNYRRVAQLTLTKKDSITVDAIEGADYTLYDKNRNELETVTTDENGKAEFKTEIVAGETYYVKETKAPKGYLIDTTEYEVKDVNASSGNFIALSLQALINATYESNEFTAKRDVPETPKQGTINIVKKDNLDNTVSGVTFDVTADTDIKYPANDKNAPTITAGSVIATLTTDAQGKASITNLPLDVTYTVTETNISAPYVKVENSQPITLTDTDDTGLVEYIEEQLSFTNTVQEVKVNLYKKDFETDASLEGAQFKITAAEDFTIGTKKVHSKGDTICTLTTDKNGYATNQPDTVGSADKYKMYVGATYTITETTPPTGFTLPAAADRTKTVKLAYSNADNKFYVTGDYTFTDKEQTGDITVIKYLDGTTTLLSGATFELHAGEQIVKADGTVRYANGALIGTATSGTNGKATFTTKVPAGKKYYIVEKTAPKGFIRKTAQQNFTLDYNAAVEYVSKTLYMYNTEQKAHIVVYKQDGDTKVGLSGAVFNIIADEDLKWADGRTFAAKDTVVDTITTGTNGKAVSKDFPLGKYRVVEVTAPTLFNKDKIAQYVTATYNANVETVEETLTFFDDRQTGGITVYKYDAELGVNGKVGLAGAVFSVTVNEDVKKADGSIYKLTKADGTVVELKAGTVIDTIVSDTDGKAVLPYKVPVGYSYTIEELSPPDNYVNKHEQQTFNLMYDAEVEFVEVEKSYFDEHQTGTIKVTKKDGKYGDLLSGATFELRTTSAVKKSDGTIKSVVNMDGETVELSKEGVVIDRVTTDENGVADFTTKLYTGYRYELVEVEPPKGYVNAHNTFRFDLKSNATVEYVSVNPVVNNTPIEVEISKRDAEGNELEGASLELSDSEGNLIDKWVSDGTNHLVSKLAAGTYTLKETAAPEGYTIATNITFTVDEENVVTVNGKEITAVSDDDIPLIVMYDSATKVAVSKQDMYGNELEGAKVEVIDSKGAVVEKWTSTKEQHIVTNLPVGTYTLRETAAPKGYHITTDIVFSIDNKNNVTVNGTKVTATSDDDIPLLVLKDEATKVTFKKVDDEGNNLAGAKLRIVDSNGKVVKEWTSTAQPMVLTATLDEDLEYTVEELEAPKGYCLSGKFSFKVKTLAELQGKTQEVTITDKPTIVEVSKVSLTGEKEIAGAKMQIIDEDGNIVDEWTSTNVAHVLRAKLEAGKKYFVHEVTPPKGYIFADDVAFTVSLDGKTDKVKMNDDDTKVSFSKRDAYGNELKGAHLQILDANGKVVVLADKDNNHITEWVSDGTNHVVRNLPAGTYTLRETAAPNGYTIATAIKFTIDEHNIVSVDGVKVKAVSDDDIPLIIMVDEATKVHFHKVDDEGNNLAGATLRIVDNKGNIVKEWISEEKPLELTAALTAGLEYTLEEVRQPAGYVLLGAFAFTVSTNGQVDIVTIENRPTIVEVSKKALTGEDEVEGATMQILDEDGKVIDEWISTTVPHVLKAQLEANKKYYVHEVTPPKFYVLSDDVEFTVSGDGSVDEVVMRDDVTRGNIEVHKRTEGDLNVEGIEFILSGISDTGLEVSVTAKTDADGVAVFELIPTGTYTITENEETVPYAYLVADEKEVTVSYAETSIQEFFNDEKTGTIEVHKRTEGDLNLEGIEFTLAGTSDSGREISLTAATDADGKVVFENVPIGTYTITENGETTPTAYLVAEPTDVTVTYAETTIKEIYNDEKTGSIEVHKTTEGNLNVEGIEFILSGISDSGREISLTATTDENGKAVFENVPIGTYTITENGETTPTAYLVADKQEVTVTYAETSEVNVHNDEKTGSIKVQKRTEDMTNIEGIEFILEGTSDSGRKIRMTATTDKNGVATFENVPVGTYTITENGDTVPTGYLVADKQSVTVYESKESSVTFENKKKETPKLVTPNRPNAVTGSDVATSIAFAGLLIPIFAVAAIRRKKEDK